MNIYPLDELIFTPYCQLFHDRVLEARRYIINFLRGIYLKKTHEEDKFSS